MIRESYKTNKNISRLFYILMAIIFVWFIGMQILGPNEQVFDQIMKMAEKSMLERIGEVQRERREYKEYIEQWIHEVKTPITAMKLLCENNRSPFSREVLAELEAYQGIYRFSELKKKQAVYTVNSTGTKQIQYYKKAYSDSTACEQKTFYVRQVTFDSQGGSSVEPQLIWTTYS